MVRVALAAALVAVTPAPAGAQTVAATTLEPGETLLEVQAEGSARYLPDAAFINVGVVSVGDTARLATDGNAATMTAVIAALRKAGIGERYVRTQQIGVEPRFARNGPQDYGEQPRITGYVARNSVAVTVTRLALAPDVIAAVFAAGANSVTGPTLGSEDPATGVAEARTDALAQARAEADTYARGLGMRVSRVLRVSERGNSARPVDYVVTGARMMAVPVAAPPAPPPPVAGGEMRRTVTVWIDYALVPAG